MFSFNIQTTGAGGHTSWETHILPSGTSLAYRIYCLTVREDIVDLEDRTGAERTTTRGWLAQNWSARWQKGGGGMPLRNLGLSILGADEKYLAAAAAKVSLE